MEPGWDCLAAPAMVAGRILVVVPKNFVMTKLNSMLEKFQLKVAVANANVTSDQLADCLKYTMAVRLAPEWNKVSNQLLHGPNFLLTYQNSIMSLGERCADSEPALTVYFSLEVEIRHRPNMQSYMSVMARQVRYPVAKVIFSFFILIAYSLSSICWAAILAGRPRSWPSNYRSVSCEQELDYL